MSLSFILGVIIFIGTLPLTITMATGVGLANLFEKDPDMGFCDFMHWVWCNCTDNMDKWRNSNK